jgi:hypothetical protein
MTCSVIAEGDESLASVGVAIDREGSDVAVGVAVGDPGEREGATVAEGVLILGGELVVGTEASATWEGVLVAGGDSVGDQPRAGFAETRPPPLAASPTVTSDSRSASSKPRRR